MSNLPTMSRFQILVLRSISGQSTANISTSDVGIWRSWRCGWQDEMGAMSGRGRA